jgi:NADPH-ferrihemoprotein reductase
MMLMIYVSKERLSLMTTFLFLLGFNAKRVDLEDFDPTQLAESRLAVFLMATYGEGEHTDNATTFHNWMKNDNGEVRENVLKDIAFTVFGLGNRQYEQFNQMGKRTNEALQICGAKRVFEYGEGDDDGSLEDDFERWRTSMWPALMSKFHPDAATAATGIYIDMYLYI